MGGGAGGSMKDDSAENVIQAFPREAIGSSSGTDRDIRSLTSFIQHFLCRRQRRPPSKVPWVFLRGCRGAGIMSRVTNL